MKHIIEIEPAEWRRVTDHLLVRDPEREQAAFLFATERATEVERMLCVAGVRLVEPDGFSFHSGYHLELSEETWSRVIKEAHGKKASIIEVHSHLGSNPAEFSASDLYGLASTVPHVAWRLKGRPFAALVLTHNDFDALVWPTGESPHVRYQHCASVRGTYPPPFAAGAAGMNYNSIRFDRNIALFGDEGQQRLHEKSVTVAGLGGVGCWVAQQVALLGPREIALVDHDELEDTDRNRSGIARYTDPVPGSLKVELAERLIHDIDPKINVRKVTKSLLSEEGFAAVINSDATFGCVDKDGVRFVLNELAVAYEIPLIDVATDVPEPGVYGGRVFFGLPGDACLVCMALLDMRDVRRFFLTEAERDAEDAIYGVPRSLLKGTGPAVVTLNMATAGLAGTEFMVWATGMRAPQRLITYHAHRSVVTVSRDKPRSDCYYCRVLRGQRDAANVHRYLARVEHRTAA